MASSEDAALWGIDLSTPSTARIFDYFLGGSYNFEVDRVLARQALEIWPEIPRILQANRAFLRRAVRFMLGEGVRQFLDIGSGIPAADTVHHVARRVDPAVRVAYVDSDPVAVTHGRSLLHGEPNIAVVQADLRNPMSIMGDPAVTGLLDFTQPVGVLMVGLLHFIADADDPASLVAAVGERVAAGSFLAVAHASFDLSDFGGDLRHLLYAEETIPFQLRSPAEVAALFGPFRPVPPGVVEMVRWRPDGHPGPPLSIDSTTVGVGRKP